MTGRRRLILRSDGRAEALEVDARGERRRVARDAGEVTLAAEQLPGDRWSLITEDGRQVSGRAVVRPGGLVEVAARRGGVRVHLADPLLDRLAHSSEEEEAGDQDEEIRALMPGRVVEVCVSPGRDVEAGALLLVLEAMKMQNEIRSPGPAHVERVEVATGAAVEGGSLLVALRRRPKY